MNWTLSFLCFKWVSLCWQKVSNKYCFLDFLECGSTLGVSDSYGLLLFSKFLWRGMKEWSPCAPFTIVSWGYSFQFNSFFFSHLKLKSPNFYMIPLCWIRPGNHGKKYNKSKSAGRNTRISLIAIKNYSTYNLYTVRKIGIVFFDILPYSFLHTFSVLSLLSYSQLTSGYLVGDISNK